MVASTSSPVAGSYTPITLKAGVSADWCVVVRRDRRAIVGIVNSEVRIEGVELADDDPRKVVREWVETIPGVIGAAGTVIADSSRMAADRAATPDLLDLPRLCQHYLGGSEDFLGGLHELMLPRPNVLQLPRFSLYPLIRGVMESSGQTVWVLGPNDRRERFRRMLQLQKAELDYDMKYVHVLTDLRDDDNHDFRSLSGSLREDAEHKRRKRWRTLLDAAAMVGIDQVEFQHGLVGGYGAVIREAADEHNIDRDFRGRQCASVWMFISGLSHPSMWRAWGGSIHEPGEVGADGSMPVWSEADPAVVRDGLGVALALHVQAIRLWKQACAAATPSANDPLPPTAAEES